MSGKKLSKNIIVYGLSNGLKSLVPFIMLPILTSYISADGIGLLSLVETSILFLAPFILLNIEAGVGVEYFKSSKQELSKYLSNGIMLSFLAFLIMGTTTYLSRNFLSSALEIPISIILLLPVFVLLRIIPSIVLVLYQAQQKPISYLIYSLFQTLFDFALSATFVILWKHGYIGRLEGTYIAFFLATFIGIYIIYQQGYFNFKITKEKIKQILSFGAPLIPHAVGGTIIAMSDRYFISYFEGNAEVGIYTVAYQVGAIMLLFSRSVNQAWSPMLYDLLNKKKYKSVDKYTLYLLVIFIAVATALYFLTDLVFYLLINPNFYSAKLYVTLLLLGFLFQSIYFLFTNFIFYSKRTEILAVITFSGALLNLALNYFLIKKMGVLGVAFATAITWFIFMFASFIVAKFKIYNIEKSS
ncbi:MAG: oligosaccharide flippase family protein [Salibacteraceae bacterium]